MTANHSRPSSRANACQTALTRGVFAGPGLLLITVFCWWSRGYLTENEVARGDREQTGRGAGDRGDRDPAPAAEGLPKAEPAPSRHIVLPPTGTFPQRAA